MGTTSDIISLFSTPVLTPIATLIQKPTYASIDLAHRELSANAMAVHSSHGGGNHGHLALTIPAADYLALTGVAFPAPVHPPINPVHLDGATGHQIRENIRLHTEEIRIFQLYHNTQRALVRLIIAAIPRAYIASLNDKRFGFANVTCTQLLTFLYTRYGEISQEDLNLNNAKMTAAWNVGTPITDLWDQLTNGANFATAGNDPISDQHLARIGYNILAATGVFDVACREWFLLPTATKTYAALQTHFERANRYRELTATTASAGYHGANLTTERPPSELTVMKDMIQQLQVALAAQLAAPPAQPVQRGYCWTHGSSKNSKHTSKTCKNKADGHQDDSTFRNKMGGNTSTYVYRPRNTSSTPDA